MFFSPNVDIPVTESPLSQTWVYQIVIQGILAGNSIYDSLTDIPQTFGVLEVLQASTVLNNAIGHTPVGPEMPVSIVPERTATASLPFYWRQALAQGHTAPIFELFFCKKIPLSRHVGYVMGGWISGSVDQWISGSVDQWISGSVDQWISGSVDQWISGSVRDVCMSHQSDWIYC